MKESRLAQQVDIHDHSQFEIRLDFNQDLNKKKNCYQVETYFFFPRSLRIDKQHYNKETFYQDLKTNIRLKTPSVAISKLVDSENDSSLKNRIDIPFNRLLSGTKSKKDVADIIYELKVFGTIFRGQVCDEVNGLISLIDQVKTEISRFPTICHDIQKLLKLLIKEINTALSVFRKLRAKFIKPIIPAELTLIFEEINEFLSLVIDTHLSRLAIAIEEVPGLAQLIDPSYTKLMQLLKKEALYREGAGYLSGDPLANDGEKYIYRKGELKKTIMEVLFLRPKLQKEGNKTSQFIAMLAASLAMAWALMAMIYGHTAFVINSTPFLILMIFSYAIKDRIKDTVKRFLHQKVFSKFFHDRKIEFYHHKTKRPVGHIRESFEFVDKKSVPDDVLRMRYPINSGKRFETIMKHKRITTLFSHEFDTLYSQITNVTRLSINGFLSKMDDATVIMPCYLQREDASRPVLMSKVYHIHLILKLSPCCKTKKHVLKHYRIVLNKDGIKRLESLSPDSQVEYAISYPSIQANDTLVDPEEIGQELEVPLAHTQKVDIIQEEEEDQNA